jgi:predicted GNAT family acetyltransferase
MRPSPTTHTVIRDVPARGRYELYVDDELAGFLAYRAQGDGVLFSSTVVDPRFRGRGLAAELVQCAMDEAERKGLSVRTTCWYVSQWLVNHPDYQHLEAG